MEVGARNSIGHRERYVRLAVFGNRRCDQTAPNIGDPGRDRRCWLPPPQTRTGADRRIRFLSEKVVCRAVRTQRYSEWADGWLLPIPVPAAAATSLRNLLWILSEPEKGASRTMVGKVIQTSVFANNLLGCTNGSGLRGARLSAITPEDAEISSRSEDCERKIDRQPRHKQHLPVGKDFPA
jgi:hypothetical protein